MVTSDNPPTPAAADWAERMRDDGRTVTYLPENVARLIIRQAEEGRLRRRVAELEAANAELLSRLALYDPAAEARLRAGG